MDISILQKLIISAVPMLFAITVHEVAHGWVACKLGDRTAYMLGRLTLNPIKHIDPIGTVLVPLALFFLGGFIFGWAKPVPINPTVFKNQRRDMSLVAIAGPTSNFLMAVIWAGIAKFAMTLQAPQALALVYMGQAGVVLNCVLALVNLLPIPPLDGGTICSNLLPPHLSSYFDQIAPYGPIILVILIVTHVLGALIGLPLDTITSLLL